MLHVATSKVSSILPFPRRQTELGIKRLKSARSVSEAAACRELKFIFPLEAKRRARTRSARHKIVLSNFFT